MIEGFAREMPEDRMLEAIRLAHDYVRQICAMQEELAQKAFAVKKPYELPPPGGLLDTVRTNYYDAFRAAKQTIGKLARADACQARQGKGGRRAVPDPAAVGAGRRSPRPGRSWKAASSAT